MYSAVEPEVSGVLLLVKGEEGTGGLRVSGRSAAAALVAGLQERRLVGVVEVTETDARGVAAAVTGGHR